MDRTTLKEMLTLPTPPMDSSWFEKSDLFNKHVLLYLLNRLPQQIHTEIVYGNPHEITYAHLKDFCYIIKVSPSSLNSYNGHAAIRQFSARYTGRHKWFSKDNLYQGYVELGLGLYDIDSIAFSARYAQLPELIKKSTTRSIAASSRGLSRRAANFTKPTQRIIAHHVFNIILQQMRVDILKLVPQYMSTPDVFSSIFSLDFLPGSLTPNIPSNSYLMNAYLSLIDVDLSGQKLYDAICAETTLDTKSLLSEWAVSENDDLRRFALTFSPKENAGLAFLDTSELIREVGKQLEEIE